MNTKEKVCAFYASDYHFEMMSLPYIDKRLENKDKIVIVTENDLEESVKTILENTNLKEDKKKKILQLNWNHKKIEELEKMKAKIGNEKSIIVFIKGKEQYIRNINQNIEKWIPEERITKIIDCYEIEEVGEKLDEIMEQYPKILRTTGEKEIEKL